jgi:hypothetical protein
MYRLGDFGDTACKILLDKLYDFAMQLSIDRKKEPTQQEKPRLVPIGSCGCF